MNLTAGVGLGNDTYSFKVSDLISLAEQEHENGQDIFPVLRVPTISLQHNLDAIEKEDTESKQTRTVAADIKYPLIVTHRDDGSLHILDGTHRLRKALEEGISELPIRIVPRKNLEKFKVNKVNEHPSPQA